MGRPKNSERAPIVGSAVQVVSSVGDREVVSAALVTRVMPGRLVNVKVMPDMEPVASIAALQFEADAMASNERGVGFGVHRYWRWPR
jgi:hypothetical protein